MRGMLDNKKDPMLEALRRKRMERAESENIPYNLMRDMGDVDPEQAQELMSGYEGNNSPKSVFASVEDTDNQLPPEPARPSFGNFNSDYTPGKKGKPGNFKMHK